ncbi:hypothetical protein F5141DRAFT_1205735 [Pisolithus sp. B1]|nr:hypothetical protein F5141DRAFT_1205735 [Pisolithus sp. B1]
MVSKRLQDKVYESSNLKIPAVKEWLHEISYAEEFWNSISGLVLPDLARVGKDAIAAKGDRVVTQPPSGTQWPSIYVGIDVIVNQETPPHLDKVSAPSLLDLLPGTMIYLAGKLLHHSVPKWEKVLQKSLGRGSLYTFQPTKTRRGKLTHKEVDARHLYFPSGSQPSTPGTPRTKASSQHLNFSDFHDSLDIPDSDWNDVDDAPQSRRHTKSQNDYIREWLPWRAEYLNIILEGEQLAKGGDFPCAVKVHRNLPFHKVQRWNGAHYQPTSLMDLGFLWHIGHGEDPCPCNWSDPDPEESGYVTGDGPSNHRKSSQFQMTIVHTEGIFSHEVWVCKCPGSDPNDWHLDLLHQRLFPASISKPKTAFTFDVLDHFLIDALECKTSAMSFYQKLKRFTNNAFPERDRYRELMRVSQLWRDLKHRKWFGFGHDAGKDPGDGGLALFCPACPQPGLNLPADWKVQYDRDTVMRQYVIDGNFTAQHMKMNKPELDVALSDGKGYMVSEGPYQNHLQQSLDTKEVRGFKVLELRSTCSNHRAINAANINKSNLRSTGIGATACARHGCFVPHSVVDFQKGERYMNTDYSICNALGYGSERIAKALVIYDVGCQWSVNFWSRVKNSPSLLLPPALEIVPAVGKFHLAAHKLSCFPRYSLNFVKGAGHLDGEILETLWAPFNKISPTARSMTQAHRQEVYDDHMRDSNWKKLVGLGEGFFSKEGKFMWTISVPSLLKKYKTSNKCLEEMNQAYEQLTAVLDPDRVSGWELDALRAEADRGEALDIYLLKEDKAPTFHEVQLQLMKNPMTPFGSGGSVAWLAEGISIEDSHQEVKISVKRQRLSARIEKFHSNGQAFFKGLEINGAFTPQDDPEFCGKEEEEEEEEDREFWGEDDGYWEVPGEEVEELASELMSIWMPSSIGSAKLTELGLVDLLKEERELRIGQANDCLDQLRTDLGNKAMEGTRTKKEIQKVVARINKHVRGYQRARQAILRLDPNVDMAEKYQEILPNDLAVSKEVTEENRFGQGTSKLAWFWMMEGELSQLSLQGGGLMEEFYRINWLKARSRRDRWKEEVSLVRHEMLWTCLWFEYHKDMWEKRALQSTEPGKEAYAKKQMGLWNDFAKKARLMFQEWEWKHTVCKGQKFSPSIFHLQQQFSAATYLPPLNHPMSDWKQAYSEILSSYVGMYKEARGNLELRNEILAEVKGKILEHEPLHSVELPQNLGVVRPLFIMLDRSEQDEIAIIQQILTLAFTGKNKEDVGEGEKAREEKARPTKAGDYKMAFTAFTAAQRVFKEEMDSYDRQRRDTKDCKTIGQRTRIVQQWWESFSDDRKAEAGRAVEKWNKLDLVLSWQINRYHRKNLPAMAKDFIETVQRTMGSHVVMFVGHESGEGQIKLALFETAPGDGKKVFTESSQSTKDWVLTAESILTDYLLTDPVEKDSAEKQEVEISLDEDGNPEVPTRGGQKLKVQQNLARAVFQAAYAKFTKKPKAKVPWGLLIKSPMEYLDPESISEGFTMKDPSKWTKANLRLLWDHWQSLEAEEKVIVSFIDCKKEDAPLSRQFDRKVVGSSKKRVWVTVDDDSEAELGGAGIPGPSVTQHSAGGPSEQTVDGGEVLGEATTDVGQSNPEESSPAWHASKDWISYLKSLSIMPRYQVHVDLVDALPEQVSL